MTQAGHDARRSQGLEDQVAEDILQAVMPKQDAHELGYEPASIQHQADHCVEVGLASRHMARINL